jgi:hypothetical protein
MPIKNKITFRQGNAIRYLLIDGEHKAIPSEVVYFLFRNDTLIYIGFSLKSRSRLCSHSVKFDYAIIVSSLSDARACEAYALSLYKPIRNSKTMRSHTGVATKQEQKYLKNLLNSFKIAVK